MSPSVRKYGPEFVADVLLHEMVHSACDHLDGDSEPGYKGHGPEFAARCNAISKLLGLAEVSAKGRGGRLDCAQWPLNVRPQGYYGDTAPRRGKTRKRDDGDASERAPSRGAHYETAIRDASPQHHAARG